jgi:hypothetical protein
LLLLSDGRSRPARLYVLDGESDREGRREPAARRGTRNAPGTVTGDDDRMTARTGSRLAWMAFGLVATCFVGTLVAIALIVVRDGTASG